jgi:hypothetical protein
MSEFERSDLRHFANLVATMWVLKIAISFEKVFKNEKNKDGRIV